MSMIDFVAVGSVIIDDIVYPDGRTSMGVLGGGGTHAAYGMALAGERPALVALVGEDLPADIRARLEHDFDISGLVWSPHQQMRAWQIFEWDGVRNEIFRVDVIEPFMFGPDADSIDIPFADARGITLLRAPEHVASWRARFPSATLLWEPMRIFMLSADFEAFRTGIPYADIVSPNLHEAQTMYGIQDEVEILRRMLADGCQVVALRMGELGSLVARRVGTAPFSSLLLKSRRSSTRPAPAIAYCGGFVVGWCRERDLATAGSYGAAAASFTLEYVGCAQISPEREAEWQRRLQEALAGGHGRLRYEPGASAHNDCYIDSRQWDERNDGPIPGGGNSGSKNGIARRRYPDRFGPGA